MNRILMQLLLIVIAIFSRAVYGDNITDLRNTHEEGLPFVALWNVNGFNFKWHVDQVRAGHRFIPSVFWPYYDLSREQNPNSPAYVAAMSASYAPEMAYLKSVSAPIRLRHNNLAQGICGAHNRLPEVEASVSKSPLVWTIKPDGSYSDEQLADTLGDPRFWAAEGKLISDNLYSKAMQQLHPSPAWVWFVENHEAGVDKFGRYQNGLHWNSPQMEWYVNAWRTPAEMQALSLRMKEWVGAKGYSSDPYLSYADRSELNRIQYRALFDMFRDSLATSWGQSLYFGAYACNNRQLLPPFVKDQIGPAPESAPMDSFGPTIYIGTYMPNDFTSPEMLTKATYEIPSWEYSRSKNPRAFRQPFVSITGFDALAAYKVGRHEPITPERWQAYLEWLLWIVRATNGGVPIALDHWTGSATTPTQKFFAPADATIFPGAGDLTHNDYVQPLMRAADHVCEDEVLRKFWKTGTTLKPLLLPCSANTATQVKVWSIPIQSADGKSVLIPAWTPCKDLGDVTISIGSKSWVINFGSKPSGYWLIETPEPIVPPQTIRKI